MKGARSDTETKGLTCPESERLPVASRTGYVATQMWCRHQLKLVSVLLADTSFGRRAFGLDTPSGFSWFGRTWVSLGSGALPRLPFPGQERSAPGCCAVTVALSQSAGRAAAARPAI